MNRYRPHLYVVPEDDRDRQLANGFLTHPGVRGQMSVVPPAGGWLRVVATFKEEYVPLLCRYEHAHVVLLIDFDDVPEQRRQSIQSDIPLELQERVFVVGPRTNPEALKRALGTTYEAAGAAFAEDCATGTVGRWGHEQMQHNEPDRLRLERVVKPFLFC